MQTYEIQNAINEAERVIDPLRGRGKRVEIYQHELAVLVAAAKEAVESRDIETSMMMRR